MMLPWQPESVPPDRAPTPKTSHIASFPVMPILVTILYVTIVCDLIYVIGVKVFRGSSRGRRPPVLQKRLSFVKSKPPVKKGVLTIDSLWRKLKAEAVRVQKINASHRELTFAMMETRRQARLEDRDKPSRWRCAGLLKQQSSTSSQVSSARNQSMDIVRWANRITTDLRPKNGVK